MAEHIKRLKDGTFKKYPIIWKDGVNSHKREGGNMKVLHISGRRWFERVNGNTYHSVNVWIDGKHVYYNPFEYGYGNHYRQTAKLWLKENGHLPGLEHYQNGASESLWRYCERNDIALVSEVTDVSREKDL